MPRATISDFIRRESSRGGNFCLYLISSNGFRASPSSAIWYPNRPDGKFNIS